MELFDRKRRSVLARMEHGISASGELIQELEEECFSLFFPLESMKNIPQIVDPHERNIAVERALASLHDAGLWFEYYAKARSMVFNLSHRKNVQLLLAFIERRLSAWQIVRLSPQELFPENWTDVIASVEERDRLKLQVTPSEKGSCSFFRCPKCGCHRTDYTEFQTRRAGRFASFFRAYIRLPLTLFFLPQTKAPQYIFVVQSVITDGSSEQ